MRRIIYIYLTLVGIVHFLMLFVVALGKWGPEWLSLTALAMTLVLVFFNLVVVISMGSVGWNQNWFKTAEELMKEKQKVREEWQRAEAMCKVIGNHEAVKLWEAKQQADGKQ